MKIIKFIIAMKLIGLIEMIISLLLIYIYWGKADHQMVSQT